MPLTLASLVQHSSLKLTVRAGEDRLDVPVRWAHVSELADPVPYLEGGELLLVTAMKLDVEDGDAMRRYVGRLAAAGVVGLGFAAGVAYETVPQALLTAAREAGFPLLEVPRRTPFLAISKAVSAANAAEQYRAVTAGFEAQRELTRAAQSARGPAALLAKLAAHIDGWAALYDASGALVAAAPAWAARRAARLTGDVERLRDRPAPASAVVGGPPAGASGRPDGGPDGGPGNPAADRVELQSIGSGRRARAVLAVGTDAPPGTAERYAVNSAVALLTLATERSRALREAEQRLGAAVLRMLLAGEGDHARAVAGTLYGGLLDAPLRVVVAEGIPVPAARRPSGTRDRDREGGTGGPPSPPAAADAGLPPAVEALAARTEAAAARAGESVLLVPHGDRLVGLVTDGGAAAAACADFAAEGGTAGAGEGAGGPEHGVVIGLSAPAGLAAVTVALKQAEQALSVARRRGRTLVEHEDVASGSVLPLLADDAVRAFADGMLRALREHDAHGRGDLVASLHAWLSRHGQWDAAAADLGVHRHTLRYRMRRVEEILGRSLDDPDARMELWLALKATTAVPPARPAEGADRAAQV
ncbi:PucR family transcriptional regulator [Streptomyces carminius]|uniref:PucR family transcriptional regulator n=1 Tax=Streptomyces carminius TaxID=2665496 RepID=A0A2M8M4X4_9ACTN|nr:PucR family transcriptional regulator [Streptomyces carminius]PJE99254.1 PucR family transcriptional regulator [Streptomyces carminius]